MALVTLAYCFNWEKVLFDLVFPTIPSPHFMSWGSSTGPKKDGVFNLAHVVTGKVYVNVPQWDGFRPEFHLPPGLDYPHFDWWPYY